MRLLPVFILTFSQPFIWFLTECKSKNITCTEIRVAEGFRYEHECPEGSEIALERNNKVRLCLFQLHFSPCSDLKLTFFRDIVIFITS